MLRSLRVRILAMTAVLVLVSIGAVGLFSRQLSLSQFRRYVEAGDRSQGERLRSLLLAHWTDRGGWEGVGPLLDRLSGSTGRPLVLVGPDGGVIALAPSTLAGARVRVRSDGAVSLTTREEGDHVEEREVVIVGPRVAVNGPGGASLGTLYVLPPLDRGPDQGPRSFDATLSRSLALAILAAGAVAMIAAFALSRRILRPVEALTSAARRLAGGDLAQRVKVSSGDEIGDLARAFNAMAAAVARAEELRRGLVADVAHELRTPLTNIRCQLEAIQDGLAAPDRSAIDSLHEETMLLKRLVDDLQDLALAEAGELRLDRADLSVPAELEKAAAAFQAGARENGIALTVEAGDALPAVFADAERLGQILRNLLSNALAHTPAGGRIVIRAGRRGDSVEITVRDSGPGISPEHLPLVFERFYRTDASRSRATGGAGLGLAIVRQLARAHGGEVRAESVPGSGASFHVLLPAAAPSSSQDLHNLPLRSR
jgi:signal transduction histidine kinase